jgi:penicillin amidase
MKRWKAIGVTVVGVIGLVAISGAVINVVKTYVAPLSTGEIRVAGLSADVEITRNEIGVPHIRAVTFDDALFGLGYAHAEDRLWQMEMNRRIGAGRLSEIFGPETLDKDKFLRTLGVYRVAERSFANLTDRAQAAFRSYALGVNAFFETRRGFLPLEFLLLGHEPEPWQVEDSLVWLKMMAWDLGGNWEKEWLRYRLMQRLSPAQVEEFLPPHPGDERPALPDFRSLYAEAGFDGERLLAMAPAVLPDGAGSNNWVVSGEHTTSGKPLLANDPHLGLQAPAVWYYARLTTTDLDVVGATLPGVPGIYLGHNGRIAWGFTNTGPDVQDLYIEKIVAGEPDRYLAPDGPRPFTVRQERIFIKDDDPVTLMVRTSRHGPILSDVLGSARTELPQDYALALAWTALREDDLTAQAVFGIMAAKDWAQFKEALRSFHTPQQSIVYADVEGNIGFYAPGRIPLRKEDNDAMGLLPVPGWDPKYDWDGFVPFEELPQSFNPESGFVFTANQKIVPDDYPHHLTYDWTKIVPDDYPHHLTYDWTLPYRARRLEALITGYESHSLETFKEMQGDVLSLVATELLPLMSGIEPLGEVGKQALDLLNAWDRRMEGDRPEPLIFYAWMRELTRLVYADELGPLSS